MTPYRTCAEIWLDYGRTLDVRATEKALAEKDEEIRQLRRDIQDRKDANPRG